MAKRFSGGQQKGNPRTESDGELTEVEINSPNNLDTTESDTMVAAVVPLAQNRGGLRRGHRNAVRHSAYSERKLAPLRRPTADWRRAKSG